MNKNHYLFIIVSAIALFLKCSVAPIAGGSDNPDFKVIGTIILTNGSPGSYTQVTLIPHNYNPITGGALPDSQKDTTDAHGAYRIDISDSGTYSIEAVHIFTRTRLLISGIKIDNDTVTVPSYTLKNPGTIKVFLPDTIDTINGYVYIEGTTIYKKLSESITDSNGLFITLDSVPEATIPSVHYARTGNPDSPVPLTDTLAVLSNDTAASDAFVYWAHYSSVNSPILYKERIQDIYIDEYNNKWIATISGGLLSFNGTQWKVYDTGNSALPGNSVNAINCDKNGLLYMATGRGGALFDGTTWTIYDTGNSGIPSNFLIEVIKDNNGVLWFGSGNAGLTSYNGTTYTVYDTLSSPILSNQITDILVDSSNMLWCATAKGVSRYDGNTWTAYTKDNSGITSDCVYKTIIDQKGFIWFVCYGNVVKYDGISWTTYDSNFSPALGSLAFAARMDKKGNLWFGSSEGLTKFDGANWVDFIDKRYTLLKNKTLYSIAIDDNDNKWIGTYEDGMIAFGPTIH